MSRNKEADQIAAKISAIAADVDAHTCRDSGYSPYKQPCRSCMTQLSLISQERHLRRRH